VQRCSDGGALVLNYFGSKVVIVQVIVQVQMSRCKGAEVKW
jgi:hypothetical protein